MRWNLVSNGQKYSHLFDNILCPETRTRTFANVQQCDETHVLTRKHSPLACTQTCMRTRTRTTLARAHTHFGTKESISCHRMLVAKISPKCWWGQENMHHSWNSSLWFCKLTIQIGKGKRVQVCCQTAGWVCGYPISRDRPAVTPSRSTQIHSRTQVSGALTSHVVSWLTSRWDPTPP